MHRRQFAHWLALGAGAPSALLPATAAATGAVVPLPALGEALRLPAELPLIDGGHFRAAQAQGQVLVLYWWASWCPFCALQSPAVEQLWRSQRTRGLMVLGLSIDKTEEAARRHRQQRGYSFPSAMHTAAVERVLPKPNPGLPITCVLGRDGRVRLAESGQLFPEDIEQIADFL